MKFAVLSENKLFVENLIILKESQKEEFEVIMGRKLMDAAPLGMEIGDFFNGKNWTRNVDGEQVALPVGDNPAVTEVLAMLEGGDANVDE